MRRADIAKIENLVGFNHLVKLQLDNNTITRIENIGHLTTLEWLGTFGDEGVVGLGVGVQPVR